jgi:hypothetical protein
MGAFKQFLSTDVTVVPFVVNKSFSFVGSASLEAAGIKKYYGLPTTYSSSADILSSSYQDVSSALVWNSIKQLYYTNYIPTPSQSQAPAPVYDYNGNLIEDYTTTATNARFYNYEQTTLFQSSSISFGYKKQFYTRQFQLDYPVLVLSIPKDIFGDYINPKSLYFETTTNTTSANTLKFYDKEGEGLLFRSSSSPFFQNPEGLINYQHGTIVYVPAQGPGTSNAEGYIDSNNVTCSFQSSRTIYETQYKCTIRPDEFNYSLNPSLISGSTDGTPYNFVTGSYFAPYVTTVGLYNEKQELLAVAKLGQPLPTSRTTDTTIIINLDR